MHAFLPLGLNGLELLLVVLAILLIEFLGRRQGWRLGQRLFVHALTLPIIVLSAAETTQFMTMDEWGISIQLFDPAQRAVQQLIMGSFLTGLPFALFVTKCLSHFSVGEDHIRMALKSLWWLGGIGMVAAITVSLIRLWRPSRTIKPELFALGFATLLMLPTTQLALKTVNYDLLSCGFAALAILFISRMLMWEDIRAGKLGVLFAILAAQEKFAVGPVLVLAIVMLAIFTARDIPQTRERVMRALRAGVGAILGSLACSMAFLFAYVEIGPPTFPNALWSQPVIPLSSWLWLALPLPMETILADRFWIGMATIVGILLLIGMIAVLWPVLQRSFEKVAHALSTNVSQLLVAAIVFAMFVAGVVGALTVQGYWAPFHPSGLAQIAHMQHLNGVALHVGAATVGEHYRGLALYALAVLVVAVPSVVWLAGFGGILLSFGSGAPFRLPLVLLLASFIIPALAVVAGIPFAHRYFNLSLLLITTTLLWAVFTALDRFGANGSSGVARLLIALFIVILIAEVAPFRPLFAAFRPFWLSYGDANYAEPGRLNASWMGWGEEVLLAGKHIVRACETGGGRLGGVNCARITLRPFSYHGLWLPDSAPIKLNAEYSVGDRAKMTRADYYVFSRLVLIQSNNIPQLKPDFVVAFRGYDEAWVYRGDRLFKSNFRAPAP